MSETAKITDTILKAHDAGATIERISDTHAPFEIADAYRVSTALAAARMARGQKPLGWKIGYTNRAVQQKYGVLHPIWGRMYDTTASEIAPGATAACDLAKIAEPRIEPEIVVRISRAPEPGMTPADLVQCIDRVGHGFEIVTSIFRDWKGTGADSIAAGALHGRYFHHPLVPLDKGRDWLKALDEVELVLFRNGVEIDRGRGTNALDGPLRALGHFIDGLARFTGERLKPGEIVTTGTLTEAYRVFPGETWHTEVNGLPVEAMRIVFS